MPISRPPSRTRVRALARRAGVGLAALSVAATTWLAAPAQAGDGRELKLTFDSRSARLENAGSTALRVREVTRNGGSVRSATGAEGTDGIRLPGFQRQNPPMAALTVTDTRGGDDLSPGAANFRFGADFTLDATSDGSATDDGDNLIQRGLWGDPLQYKVQVDGRRSSCRVKGAAGAVVVRSDRAIPADEWYRVHCTRRGSEVTLVLVRLRDGKRWISTGRGSTGALRAPQSSTPLSIGGKTRPNGGLVSGSTDQFNGRVDNAFLNVY